MKISLGLIFLGMVLGAGAATLPDVTGVTMTQASDRSVRVAYTLAEGPAIVTLAVETNAADGAWLPAGGRLTATALGDVNRVVESGAREIVFTPDRAWPDGLVGAGAARAVVTAWPLDDPPDYLAVDLAQSTNVSPRVRYYPDAESVPGGVVSNEHYRLSTLLLRRMHARGRTWMMGAVATSGRATTSPRSMTLTNDYYIGVFELTQQQWLTFFTDSTNKYIMATAGDRRELYPAPTVSYVKMRDALVNNVTPRASTNAPASDSFLGKLRTRTGIAFDLPTDAEWEFAAKGGQPDGFWGNGAPYLGTDVDANLPGAYSANCKVMEGTNMNWRARVCGSFAPNAYGLYDLHGNVWEWVRDSAWSDINTSGNLRPVRGGGHRHSAQNCRACIRVGVDGANAPTDYGARVRCPIDIREGLEEVTP